MMLNHKKRFVYLATPEELADEHYYRRLWLAVRNIDIARRNWLDELSNTFRDFDGVILYRSNVPYQIPNIDDLFGNDPSMRWMGHFMATASNDRPKSRVRKLERVRFLDLYFRVKHPHIARKFSS